MTGSHRKLLPRTKAGKVPVYVLAAGKRALAGIAAILQEVHHDSR